MRERWDRVSLGEVTERREERVEVGHEPNYRLMGIRWKNLGAYERGNSQTAPSKSKIMFRIRDGDFVFNRIDTDKGAFAVVAPELDLALASNEFPAYRTRADRLDARFLWLHFQQDHVLRAIHGSGSEGRARWKEHDFETHSLNLPPLADQQRIVDLIATLDEVIEASEAHEQAVDSSLSSVRDREFRRYRPVQIGELLESISGGRSPSASDAPPAEHEYGVLKVSAIGSRGFQPLESKTVMDPSVFSDAMSVRSGDILITRANTAERVGMVCLVGQDYPNLFLSDKTLRLTPRSGVDRMCLVAALQTTEARQQLSASGSGTSASMKNISQANIRGIKVGWPEKRDDQRRLADLVASFEDVRDSAADIAHMNRFLRAELLSALLSGDHEIPATYDRFIDRIDAA